MRFAGGACRIGGVEEAIFVAGCVATMTARQGRIKREIAVELPHPRHYTIKTTPAFSALKARLTEEIRIEALRASDAAGAPAPARG
jgi:NitT/TauT family transport system ATP-binding protein/sulfonate transport system ATP-binding protein